MKYTSHRFLDELQTNHPQVLPNFLVESATRKYHFWQRNSLPIHVYTEKVFIQKSNYIHNNPVQEKWNLSDTPENYHFSSAQFYKTGIDNFGILTHWQE